MSRKLQFVWLAIFSLAACASAYVEVDSLADYHEKIAIPLATKIKAAEDAILANQNTAARIVGGNVAKPNSHPFLAGLIISYVNNPGTGVCGSTLVSLQRLLTAAHCWRSSKLQASRFVVVLESHFLFSGGQRIPTWRVVTYPQWTPSNSQNNLAVIYLQKPIIATPNIKPIALPKNLNETFVGEWAWAVGYGTTSDNQTNVPVLSVVNEVNLQVITVDECRRTYGARAQPNTICTSGTGGVGICSGDGGGPLYITRSGEPVLIGISTFIYGVNRCQRGFPSGFSRVTSFYNFINEHLQ